MGFKSSNDLEFGMAVINVLPSDGKVIDEGPVGCSVDVCNDDFRFLDVGLPPEILRLKDAGLLRLATAYLPKIPIPRLLPAFVPSGIACLRRHFIFRCRAIELLR